MEACCLKQYLLKHYRHQSLQKHENRATERTAQAPKENTGFYLLLSIKPPLKNIRLYCRKAHSPI